MWAPELTDAQDAIVRTDTKSCRMASARNSEPWVTHALTFQLAVGAASVVPAADACASASRIARTQALAAAASDAVSTCGFSVYAASQHTRGISASRRDAP
jgi:hypothetical protein